MNLKRLLVNSLLEPRMLVFFLNDNKRTCPAKLPGVRGEVLCIFLGGGVPLGLWNPYPIQDHVQLILQLYAKLDTENPYPIPDLLFLELYRY